MMQAERTEDQYAAQKLHKVDKKPNGDQAHSICIVYELKQVGGQLNCDGLETVDLQYFGLDEMPELFCKQHEEIKNDLRKRRNEAKH